MTHDTETHNIQPKLRSRMHGARTLAGCIGVGLAVASVIHELRKSPSRRTWHGALFGRIPYDWRAPTPSRVVNAFWEPGDRHFLRPTAFGVGWSINLAAMLRR
jgi:hypothetical protein